MHIFPKKAFTLIELLVVIAIIGLLATIIGVNVNSARNKANTAKSIQFSDNIYHSIGDNCVAYYDFNDTTDGTLKDISGNNNTGTIHGAVSTTSLTYSGGNLGNALYFDGVDDYVDCGISPNLIATDFTISLWLYKYSDNPSWVSVLVANHKDNLGYSFELGGQLYGSNAGVLLIRFQNGFEGQTNAKLSNNTWYFVTVTYDWTTRKVKYYINGILDSTKTSSVDVQSSSGSVTIGARPGPSYRFNGFIDEVYIYSSILTSTEIERHYAEGLLRHLLAQN